MVKKRAILAQLHGVTMSWDIFVMKIPAEVTCLAAIVLSGTLFVLFSRLL